MQNESTHKAYRFYNTVDGSPTLEFSYVSGLAESMHNSQGAFEESVYIYGHALELSFKAEPQPQVLSVGLGLGYNEFLTAAYSLAHGLNTDQLRLTSFEHEAFLKAKLLAFLEGHLKDQEFLIAYEWILKACASRFELQSSQIVQRLLELKNSGRWSLEAEFDPFKLKSGTNWNIFLYDAFSSKITPQLWSEEGLTHLLKNHALDTAFFSTYAATGALKRALKASGFIDIERAGFSGKRQSTFGIKGSETSL